MQPDRLRFDGDLVLRCEMGWVREADHGTTSTCTV